MHIIEELQLNPKLFEDSCLRPGVREKLIEIVSEFLSQIDEDLNFDVLDVRLVGSNASYNYTEKSDLDLHLVVDLSQICRECPAVVQYLFNSEKSRFNLNYDISVKGVDVEIYVEDVRAMTQSNGIYSVTRDCWIKYPILDYSSHPSIIDSVECNKEIEEVRSALLSGDSKQIRNCINELYLMRKEALETDGESGEGNLIFKRIRNLGLLDQLKDKYYEVRSQELTLESIIIEEM